MGVIDGVRAAVANGEIDERLVDALRSAGRQVTATRPPPAGASSWSPGDIDDVVSQTLSRVKPATFVTKANGASTDGEFFNWIVKAVRSTLNLQAEDTPVGRVLRDVKNALAEDDRFHRSGGRWTLAGTENIIWDGDKSHLVAVADTVDTRIIRRAPDANKIQIAWREDTRAVCTAVLAESGPLDELVLAEVVAIKFNAMFDSRFGYLGLSDLDEKYQTALGEAEPGTADVEELSAAASIFVELTEDERDFLSRYLAGAGLRELGEHLSSNKDAAKTVRVRIEDKLRRLAARAGDDDGAATELLLEMIRRSTQVSYSYDDHGDASVN